LAFSIIGKTNSAPSSKRATFYGKVVAFCMLVQVIAKNRRLPDGWNSMDQLNVDKLTDRQKDCLRLVAQGFTSKEIGRLLDLSPSTVDNHVTTAVQSLGAPNRGAAARALAEIELGQKLPRQPLAIAQTDQNAILTAETEGSSFSQALRQLLVLPPVGGKRNDLDGTSRTLRILQVAVLALASVIALTILVSGLFRTFG
jgi:DNA-binding CsgD family transcriptional regulator